MLMTVVIMIGCSDDEVREGQEEKDVDISLSEKEQVNSETAMYENETFGVAVYEQEGWSLSKEENDPTNVVFEHEDVTSILTLLTTKKSVQDLKDELLSGANNVTVVEDEEQFLAYETDRQESVRSDVYFSISNGNTIVLTFVTAADEYGEVEDVILGFHEQVKY